ncbi:unnamed protein product [Moneuplotes crassus]|uniref:Uncharacterized protein n=1 Tax=Euplotes crassus TaxID=5936 RepID=A0AAD1XYA2_EUPCR|nr:unnamed protein product [Moneuplotes crassus]
MSRFSWVSKDCFISGINNLKVCRSRCVSLKVCGVLCKCLHKCFMQSKSLLWFSVLISTIGALKDIFLISNLCVVTLSIIWSLFQINIMGKIYDKLLIFTHCNSITLPHNCKT